MPRDLVSNTFDARVRKKRPGKIPQAGGGEALFNDQKDGKHCKYQYLLLLEASKVHQNHAICIVFDAFTPGNQVSTDGFELSSAQNHSFLARLYKNTVRGGVPASGAPARS